MGAARGYYVPATTFVAAQPATRVPGEIVFSVPYTSAYVPGGARRVYIYLSGQAIAQSGQRSDFFSYPYSCVTYAYAFSPGTRSYPIDAPFGNGFVLLEESSPSVQIGTHYGRAAIAPSSHSLVAGLWSAYPMPASATMAYSPTHLFPWERGYVESTTLDWMHSTRVVYRSGSEVIAWAPIEYSTQLYSYGSPVADTRLSLVSPSVIQ